MPRLHEMKLNSFKPFLAVSAILAVCWYFLCTFFVSVIFSYHPLAFALCIYFSGFCEVGLEKFFYSNAKKKGGSFPKKAVLIGCCLLPILAIDLLLIIVLLLGSYVYELIACLVIALGTFMYRQIYTFHEEKLMKR